jgi:hypothetical protein
VDATDALKLAGAPGAVAANGIIVLEVAVAVPIGLVMLIGTV